MDNEFNKEVAAMIERTQIKTLNGVLMAIAVNDMDTVSQVRGLIHGLIERLEGDSNE